MNELEIELLSKTVAPIVAEILQEKRAREVATNISFRREAIGYALKIGCLEVEIIIDRAKEIEKYLVEGAQSE